MKISRRGFLLGSAASLAGLTAGAAVDALWLEPRWLRVRRIQLSDGPAAVRFVHFSDLHHKGDRPWLDLVMHQINALRPAFVCFTGDIVESARYLADALEALAALKAPLFGVPGNHDHWSRSDFAVIGRCFAGTGGAWLVNAVAGAPSGAFQLVGVDRLDAMPDLPATTLRRIVLMHYPLWADRLAGHRFDLLLAGHSHGGQLRVPFLGAPVVPFDVGRYVRGLYATPAGPLHVNPGIGTLHINARLACRPEITVLEL